MTAPQGRILVTGGTGFIGGRVVERLVLEHDAEVRVLVRNPATALRLARLPVELVVGDLTDAAAVRAAVEGCTAVLHCAHDTTSGRGHWSSGYEGTRHVAQAVLQHGVGRMVHLSSLVVYGATGDGPLTETTPWREGSGRYTAAKRAGEELVVALHRDQGLPASVLQPTIVYGPFGDVWTRGVIEALRTGRVPLLDRGEGLCNAVYVDDVVDAVLLAATVPDAVGERFLISAAEPVTWKRFYGAFEQLLDGRATVEVPHGGLRSLQRAERRRARQELRDVAMSLAAETLRRREVQQAALALRSTRVGLDLVSGAVGERRWGTLKAQLRGGGAPSRPQVAPRPKVHLPDTQQTALFTARTAVRIDKARATLGYAPRYDLGAGMALTEAYLRWARLV